MASIDIFIGDSVDHASERATLLCAVASLSKHGISAVVLANANINGRQIDLVIGFDHGVLVIECKGFTSAVRGGESGLWEAQLASGRWKEIPNAYAQTLAEKLALRDAMGEFTGADVSYPDAALLFVPGVPIGSTIPKGDFKVSIGGLDQLPSLITTVKPCGWSLDQWRAFAGYCRLTPVTIDSALSPELYAAERSLKTFGDAFRRAYGPLASEMVAVSCVGDNETYSSATILERASQHSNVLLTGPSGCGKSLLSYKFALEALERGRVPIVIPAKNFEGSLRDVANREVTLLDATSLADLISAARRSDRRLLLIVDGYNECTPSERERLTRSIAAAMRRYDADVVVSSRISLERNDLLPLRQYSVQLPNTEVKLAIARNAAGDASLDRVSELLDSVGSGLEARMIGQLGQHLPSGVSRYNLFDAYVRERLGLDASDGIRALSRVAGMMTERISFGLSVRELDRLLDREGISGQLLQALQAANILDRRGDRMSFSHEMFLNVFAAEAIVRRAGNDCDGVIAALRLPQHLEANPFVLGAIDDDSFRRRVLSGMSDERVIRACLEGQCGVDAQRWANERCDDVLARVAREIETVRFDLSKDFYWDVRAKPETLQNWTAQGRAILAAIPHELVAGRRLDDVLNLIEQMDERLAVEHRRLRDEAREKQVGLRTGLYAVSYTGVGQGVLGLCRICSPVDSGHLYDGPNVTPAANLYGRLLSETLTPGQIGLLVGLDRYSDRDARPIGRILPGILNRVWAKAAHHLRLGLMHAVVMSAHALVDDERRALVAVIEALPMGKGNFDAWGVLDALKSLGALDDDQEEHVATVKVEIAAVLGDRDNPQMWDAAVGLWNAQFDHPYDSAYCEEQPGER